jgi:hypothetical protein
LEDLCREATHDPVEQKTERRRAKALAGTVTSGVVAGDKIRYALQSALTYVREKKQGKANSALNAVAKQAQDA